MGIYVKNKKIKKSHDALSDSGGVLWLSRHSTLWERALASPAPRQPFPREQKELWEEKVLAHARKKKFSADASKEKDGVVSTHSVSDSGGVTL